MTLDYRSPAVFLASAAQQAVRMADSAEREGDDAKAEMLRGEAEKLTEQAQDAQAGANRPGEDHE